MTPLQTLDPSAHERLILEVEHARQEGYEVSFGTVDDVAYERPDKIAEVYELLHELDEELAVDRHKIIARGTGRLGINPLRRSYNREKAIDDKLEPLRIQRLFAPVHAVQWHEQRGRAAALLSIVAAHDLQIDGSSVIGKYQTMSGPLDERVLGYTFGENAPRLAGMSIHQALLYGEQRFGGRSGDVAESRVAERLVKIEEFIQAPVSPRFRDIVEYCADALGIRSRKAEVHLAIREHIVDTKHGSEDREYLMMSFGCGTALPMLEVIQDLKMNHNIRTRLILLDQDPLALASAACLAEDMGVGDNIEIHCEQLFSKLGRPIKLQSILHGRKLDVAEDSGLREYLPDMIYRGLTRESWRNLRAGGLMTTGNMNRNRPQVEFLRGMMGWWPQVRRRSIADGLRLHREAGVPRHATRARVTRDGVYTMYFSEKQ